MAVTLFAAPPSVAFAKKRIAVTLQSDLAPSYVTPFFRFTFDSQNLPIANDTLSITYKSKTLTFTFKNTPVSPFDLPTYQSGGPANYVASTLYTAFKACYAINAEWTVSNAATGQINFTYRANERFTISTTTPAGISATQSNNAAVLPNFNAFLSITDTLLNLEGVPIVAPFDVFGRAEFDISSLFPAVRAFVPPQEALDNSDLSACAVACDGAFRRYRLAYAERFGTPPSVQALTFNSTNFDVVAGELNAMPQGDEHAVNLSVGYAINKKVSINQPEFVYLWHKSYFDAVFIEVTIFYDDGTTDIYLPLGAQQLEVVPNTQMVYATGYKKLGINTLVTDKVVAYEWRLLNDNSNQGGLTAPTTLIASRRYDIEEKSDTDDFFLFIETKNGVFDTIRLQGGIKERFKTKQSDIEYATGEKETYGEELRKEYEISTVMLPTDMCQHYSLFLKGDMYLIKNGQFLPIVRITKEYEINPKAPFNALRFAFELAFKL